MGSGSSIISRPLVEQHIIMTIQTPNVICLMDSDGPSGVAYQVSYYSH
jgi:hypothetical protein